MDMPRTCGNCSHFVSLNGNDGNCINVTSSLFQVGREAAACIAFEYYDGILGERVTTPQEEAHSQYIGLQRYRALRTASTRSNVEFKIGDRVSLRTLDDRTGVVCFISSPRTLMA
jgi:hypothetical protein